MQASFQKSVQKSLQVSIGISVICVQHMSRRWKNSSTIWIYTRVKEGYEIIGGYDEIMVRGYMIRTSEKRACQQFLAISINSSSWNAKIRKKIKKK